jgi:hypothetical protein
MFDPVGPNVSTLAATPSAAHASTYRQNIRVVGKPLYRHLRFTPAFRPAAEDKQVCNAVALNAPDGIPSPLHAMHFFVTNATVNAQLKCLFHRSGLLCRFLGNTPATPPGLQYGTCQPIAPFFR